MERVLCRRVRTRRAARRPRGVRLRFHLVKACVVVGELLEVCPDDLAGQYQIVIGDVRFGIARTVLEFHFETATELIEINMRPINTEFATNPSCLVGADLLLPGHVDTFLL